jgi:hypothetical protein
MTLDTNSCEKAMQLLIKARGSSWGNTGSTPHFESGESPVSHESSKIPILARQSTQTPFTRDNRQRPTLKADQFEITRQFCLQRPTHEDGQMSCKEELVH